MTSAIVPRAEFVWGIETQRRTFGSWTGLQIPCLKKQMRTGNDTRPNLGSVKHFGRPQAQQKLPFTVPIALTASAAFSTLVHTDVSLEELQACVNPLTSSTLYFNRQVCKKQNNAALHRQQMLRVMIHASLTCVRWYLDKVFSFKKKFLKNKKTLHCVKKNKNLNMNNRLEYTEQQK